MIRPAPAKSLTESPLGVAVPPSASISRHTSEAGSSPVPSPPSEAPTSLTTTLAPSDGKAPGDVFADPPARPGHHRHPSLKQAHRGSITAADAANGRVGAAVRVNGSDSFVRPFG